jgi:hypothetical protein
LTRFDLGGTEFGAHTLLVSVLVLLLSAQLVSFSLLAKTFADSEGLLRQDEGVERISRMFTSHRCLWVAGGLVAAGAAGFGWKFCSWVTVGFDYSSTLPWLIPASGAIALGFQLAFCILMLTALRMERR